MGSSASDMSTRSYIGIELDDGRILGSYCHSDGYLTYNGAMLLDHYSDRAKVEKLISLGDMATLNECIDPNPDFAHSFEDRQEGVTVFYGRDRREKGTEPKIIDLDDINSPDSWIEYCYVYGKDGKWRYFVCGQSEKPVFRDLKEGLDEEYRCLGFKRPKGYYGFYTKSDVEKLREEAEMVA